MVSVDPTQFQTGQSSAITRRLGTNTPVYGGSTAGNPIADPSRMPAPPVQSYIDRSAPYLQKPISITTPTGGVVRSNPSGGSQFTSNPLSGGTGDPALDAYLGSDTTYESQLSDLMRNYDQYLGQRNLSSSQTQADYDAKQRALGTQSTQDKLNMRNAAAAQGILYSGIYANQLGQYNTANQQQLTNLLGGLQNSKDNSSLAFNNFVANEIAAKEQAIQQAAARRAAQLGQF